MPDEARLTPTMRRNLDELQALANADGEAYWWPTNSGEWRCAAAMETRGLLHRDFSNWGRGRCFVLTAKGLAA